MKKLMLVVLFVLLTFTVGCKDDKLEKSFVLTKEILEIEINQFGELPIELTNLQFKDLKFDFSIKDIVLVEGELLMPFQVGETTLTISYKDIVETIDIKVTNILPKVRLSGDYLEVGSTTRVDIINLANQDFHWVIADESIVTLTVDGNFYNLNALKIGTTTLTVTSKTDPLFTNTITIEVREVAPILDAPLQLLKVGDVIQMTITNLDGKTLNDYTWKVSDESIITLDDKYLITALKEGKSVVTVTSKTNNLVQGTFEITVATPSTETNAKGEPSKGPLFLGASNPSATVKAGEAIDITILGGKDNYNYRWRPLDPTIVAATDQGVVMGIKEGRTTLTVWNKDDNTIRGEIDITVTGTPNVDYAKRIVAAGMSEKGYLAGYNQDNKFGDWFMYNNVDWCAIFVAWCVNQAGIGIDVIPKFALVSDGVRWFKNQEQYRDQGTYQPEGGDIIFFHRNGRISHVGIVTGSDSERVYTIEGNTSNGVFERSYLLTDTYVLGYGLPAYPPFTE